MAKPFEVLKCADYGDAGIDPWSMERAINEALDGPEHLFISFDIDTLDPAFAPGNGSNTAGIEWLAQYLGAEYTVHEVRLTKKMLHLDCCFATPRPGLAIACREGFVGGLPEFVKDWTVVDVPLVDAKEKMACNGLVIDEKTIMIAEGLDYLAKGLRNAGQEVIETPFDAVYQFGGAFRCWHHALVRES